jgi:monofunctional biosynthetic peptidoglycan transglycosylase
MSRRSWRRRAAIALGVVLVLPAIVVAVLRFVPPPWTPLMLIRAVDGSPLIRDWQPLAAIAPALPRAVIAAEDNTFCTHYGFDLKAVREAWERNRRGRSVRGGSTISMQTAKNLFLWPARSFLRKGLEAWLTVYLEALWDKRRIMEVYLNIVEWGPGIYGAEAAAKYHFGKSARALSDREAALLASVLPSPLSWSAGDPGPYVQERAGVVHGRGLSLGPLARCW